MFICVNLFILEIEGCMEKFKVRLVKKEDIKAILNIYAYYVENTSITFECEVPTIEVFEKRVVSTSAFFPYLVLEDEDGVAGYCYASFYRVREAYRYSCELSIYVDVNKRGKGFGNILYERLEKILKVQGFQNIYACITYPNVDSERFHQKHGFVRNAHFHKCGYKFDRWYDMIWMEKIIGNHPEKMEPLQSVQDINVEELL